LCNSIDFSNTSIFIIIISTYTDPYNYFITLNNYFIITIIITKTKNTAILNNDKYILALYAYLYRLYFS